MGVNRRGFFKGAAAYWFTIGVQSWVGRSVSAADSRFIRHGAHTPEGKKNLLIYAKGVSAMMNTQKYPDGDPRSWLFQWYTHMVRSDRTKASELSRVYKQNDPFRDVAIAMWNTCQSHMGQNENYFLPWHRMYVLAFEEIIRVTTGDESFSLPYWDYTDPAHRAMPGEFRQKNDPIWGALFRSARKPKVNEGEDIDKLPGASAITLNALKSPIYGESPVDVGFCQNIDNDPHGAIHVNVGNNLGMGRVPWAAGDPIFWLHHCNIDRLWASWAKAGGRSPKDLSGVFTFANRDGSPIQLDVSNFMDTKNYEYDKYVKRPDGSIDFDRQGLGDIAISATSRLGAGAVVLKSSPTQVRLAPEQGGVLGDVAGVSFGSRVKKLAPGRAIYLRFDSVSAKSDPGASFDVYLTLKSQTNGDRSDAGFIGTLNFFNATHGPHKHGGHLQPRMARNYSFILDDRAKDLLKNVDVENPSVLLIPNNAVAAGASPTIGKISLIAY